MTFKKITPNYPQTSYISNSVDSAEDKIITDVKKIPESFCYQGVRTGWLSGWWYFAGHLEDEQNPAHKFGLTLIFFKNPSRILFNLSDSEEQENFSGTINFQNYDILEKERLNLKKYDFFWISTEDAKYQAGFKYNDRQIGF